MNRDDILQERIDALGLALVGSTLNAHTLSAHASPKALSGSGSVISGSFRGAASPRQDHWIGKTAHVNGQRLDQDTSEGSGQPCGATFISQKYICRFGLNIATSPDLNVHLEGDKERVDDIKRAIMYYTNSPNRIKRVQARIAIQDGWAISVHGYSENEKLSRLGLDRVALKKIREKAELLENYIEKAPKYEGAVHRGVYFGSSKDAESFIDDLQNSVSASVDSWSARKSVAEVFSGINEPKSWQRAAVVLTQKNKHGASIKRYSAIPEENEVLQPSGLRYQVLSITERVEGSLARPLTIYEVEVEPVERRSMQRKTVFDSLKMTQELHTTLNSLQARLQSRIDALKRKCRTGYGCGSTCISLRDAAMAPTYPLHMEQRNDAVKRKCATGYSCGASCISMNKVCRKTPGAGSNQQKMQRILALAAGKDDGPAVSGGARAKAATGAAARAPKGSGGAEKSGGADAPTTKEMRSAVFKVFGVKSTAALLANSDFRDSTAGDPPRTFKGKNANEEWRQLYREFVGVPKDERNLKEGGSVINGIDILKNFRPWHVFQLDPKTATKADIDKAFRKLALKHHPDAGGDRKVFEKLVSMKNSVKALMRTDSLQARINALRARCG